MTSREDCQRYRIVTCFDKSCQRCIRLPCVQLSKTCHGCDRPKPPKPPPLFHLLTHLRVLFSSLFSQFWFGLGALRNNTAVDAALEADRESIADTEVVTTPEVIGEDDPFDFDVAHPPPQNPAPSQTAIVQLPTCLCGFCQTQIQPDNPIPLPIVLQMRHGDRKVNVTLHAAQDSMPIFRGGRKSSFKTVVTARSGRSYDHLSSCAKAVLNMKSVNGFKVSYVNTTSGPIPLSKLPRRFSSGTASVADPGICTAS